MPAAKSRYLTDPDDAELARVVGAWAPEKQHYVQSYMSMFANSMKGNPKWPGGLTYVDLFAGPGVCAVDDGSGEFYEGPPLVALDLPFTNFLFVDKDPRATAALEKRVARRVAGRSCRVITDDCNAAIAQVVELIPKRSLTFAFVDPTNWQVHFDTIAALVRGRAVDVVLTFQGAMLRRVRRLDEQPRVDRFFGTKDWRPPLGSGEVGHLYTFVECYRRQMATLEYSDVLARLDDPGMKNSKGSELYKLLFFSRSELAHGFWNSVVNVRYDGQIGLFKGALPVRRSKARRAATGR